ncbi:hypothetical protein [Dysgonomonas sp. 520]|uniref:hypothetical protein n=1 Tax=Dysgonomonas sp. 520 TaxID=2302931 RepID=UPI0013D1BDBD|nr:hypothetical protein [Dysgonomonas sp. 520]NDW10109.1 hypothetical protein [Dysgonomonas sp. 520]
MRQAKYSILYYFTSDEMSIVEIKRNIVSVTDKRDVNFWLLYDKKNDSLNPLSFVSMDKKDGKEYRTFEDSRLEFDGNMAKFNDGKKEFVLKAVSKKEELPLALKDSIDDYILLLSFR